MTNPLNRVAAAVCGLFILLFGYLSYSAVITKSATFDEPLHVVSAYLHRYHADYRIDPEDPALFGWWASTAIGKSDLIPATQSPKFIDSVKDHNHDWDVAVSMLFDARTHGDDVLNHARFCFVLIGVALAALVAGFAWWLAGPVAAMTACVLFCLDPNFLAHAGLVKNDVMMSASMALLGLCLWRLGTTGKWTWLAALALVTAVGFNVKFSGILFGPMILLTLGIRALCFGEWTLCGVKLATRRRRVLAAVAVCALVGLSTILGTWAAYGFRFAPTPDGRLLDTAPIAALSQRNYFVLQHDGTPPTVDETAAGALPAPLLTRALLTLQNWRVLPQAWIYGFLFTATNSMLRSSYLMGNITAFGSRAYFPAAMLFKTPTATLAATGLTGLLLALPSRLWPRKKVRGKTPEVARFKVPVGAYAWVCLLVPPTFYLAVAILQNLNLGLRHVLPVYPYLFVIIGIGTAGLIQLHKAAGIGAAFLIVLGLATESLTAYPNYLPFFNGPSGSAEGGLALLGDSNLDWGQDLKLLAEWQKLHPDTKLYLCYFGTADPSFYGVKALSLPGSRFGDKADDLTLDPSVCAISATALQGIYMTPQLRDFYGLFAPSNLPPRQILGGSIYLYDWPPPARVLEKMQHVFAQPAPAAHTP